MLDKYKFQLGDFVVLKSSDIKEVFESTKNTFNPNLNNRIEMTINRLCAWIENDYEKII